MRISSITKNAGKACNNRLYRHIRTFEKIVKNYFVIYDKSKQYFSNISWVGAESAPTFTIWGRKAPPYIINDGFKGKIPYKFFWKLSFGKIYSIFKSLAIKYVLWDGSSFVPTKARWHDRDRLRFRSWMQSVLSWKLVIRWNGSDW